MSLCPLCVNMTKSKCPKSQVEFSVTCRTRYLAKVADFMTINRISIRRMTHMFSFYFNFNINV